MLSLAVIGTGRIGGEVAYLASVLNLVDKLILHDASPQFLMAQAQDIRHTGLEIEISTDLREIRHADICLFTAGAPRTPNIKTRAELLDNNLPACKESLRLLSGFSGILISVTNPVDAVNYYLYSKTGLERSHCIGFGGQIDSTRFSCALRERKIDATNACVIGEHGDNQVPIFSRLPQSVSYPLREEILSGLRNESMNVILGKGGTVFGPAYHIASLIRMIMRDEKRSITCSTPLDGEYGHSRCSLGVPVTISREGITNVEVWELDDWETQKLSDAALFTTSLCRRAVG